MPLMIHSKLVQSGLPVTLVRQPIEICHRAGGPTSRLTSALANLIPDKHDCSSFRMSHRNAGNGLLFYKISASVAHRPCIFNNITFRCGKI